MKALDRFIQRRRLAKVLCHFKPGDRILDVGCSDGVMFQVARDYSEGIGIDPFITSSLQINERARLIKGWFPTDLPDDRPFDVITLMAVLEHIPPDKQAPLAADMARHLKPGGQLLITVPSPKVDHILAVMKFLRIIDGMSLHEHYGYDVNQTESIFAGAGLKMLEHRRFQMGLNHFYRFIKPNA